VSAPLVALAQEPTASDPALDEARELIRNGEYDTAIEKLRKAIDDNRQKPEPLGAAYLQLIKTYVFLGNDYKFRPQGREMSNLNYRAARDLIVEAFEIPELRHLKPEPASEYPPEMISLFSEVRSLKFGAFRVAGLTPSNAVVTLDGKRLGPYPGDTMPGEVNLLVGTHRVEVSAPGYENVVEEVTISPNATLERSYQMTKQRGTMWYVTRGAVLAAAVGAVVLLAGGSGDDEPSGPEPLPGAPPPPP
jgi:hypothetical protein